MKSKEPKKDSARKPAAQAAVPPVPPKPTAPRVDPRLKQAAAILLGVAALFVLSNAGYFLKRLGHGVKPPVVAEAPKDAPDPYLLDLAGKPDRLLIPSLGIEAPIVESATRTQAAYKEALRNGVAHLPGAAEPGDVGNAYLFGHSSDLPWARGDYKTVFALLPEIELGAMIYVTDHDGNAFAYAAESTRVVRPDDLSVFEDSGNGKRTLTLQTSYPIGTALRRFIVSAAFEAEILVR